VDGRGDDCKRSEMSCTQQTPLRCTIQERRRGQGKQSRCTTCPRLSRRGRPHSWRPPSRASPPGDRGEVGMCRSVAATTTRFPLGGGTASGPPWARPRAHTVAAPCLTHPPQLSFPGRSACVPPSGASPPQSWGACPACAPATPPQPIRRRAPC